MSFLKGNFIFLFFILLLSLSFVTSCKDLKKGSAEKLDIVVSVNPLAYIVKGIGGDKVNISVVVPSGSNPHVFEPTPSQLISFGNADCFVCAGLGFEFWKEKFLESVLNKGMVVLDLSQYVDIINGERCERKECSGHSSGNPHFWTSPREVMKFTEPLKEMMVKLDPANKEYYEGNTVKFLSELSELDKLCKRETALFVNKRYASQHSAWVYFARDYGLSEVGIIEMAPGREPSPLHIKKIIDSVRASDVKMIFADRQFSQKASNVIASECSAKIVRLDPLGEDMEMSYADFIKHNLELMKKGQ